MLRRAVAALVAACAAAGDARHHDAYVASLVERCEPPRVGLRAWALRELREASRGPRAPRSRGSPARSTPASTRRAGRAPARSCRSRPSSSGSPRAAPRRASADAAPSTLAAPLLLDCVLGAFREPALRAAARLFLGLALGRRGDLAGAREYRPRRDAAAADRGNGAGPGLVDAVDVQLGAVLVAAGGDGRDEGSRCSGVAKPAANATPRRRGPSSASCSRASIGGDAAARDWAAARYGGPPADEAARLGPLDSLGAADHAALARRSGAGLQRRGAAPLRPGPGPRRPARRARARCLAEPELARSPDDDVDDLFAHPSVAREAPPRARRRVRAPRVPAGGLRRGRRRAAARDGALRQGARGLPVVAAPALARRARGRLRRAGARRVAVVRDGGVLLRDGAIRRLDRGAYGAEEQRRCPATSPARDALLAADLDVLVFVDAPRARAAVLAAAGAPRFARPGRAPLAPLCPVAGAAGFGLLRVAGGARTRGDVAAGFAEQVVLVAGLGHALVPDPESARRAAAAAPARASSCPRR
ncbi:methyltransferase [Aureococcus anophagefferens]|nr:methyltransferase [Aureococcus anophagefferens]